MLTDEEIVTRVVPKFLIRKVVPVVKLFGRVTTTKRVAVPVSEWVACVPLAVGSVNSNWLVDSPVADTVTTKPLSHVAVVKPDRYTV